MWTKTKNEIVGFKEEKMGWFKKKEILCRHPGCNERFYTRDQMLKHYCSAHEGSLYKPAGEEQKRYDFECPTVQSKDFFGNETSRRKRRKFDTYQNTGVDKAEFRTIKGTQNSGLNKDSYDKDKKKKFK